MAVQLHPLHQRRDLTDECVEVINSEWPRSKAMRLHSLEKSCTGLPYSLVMTETQEGKERVIGYCRLAKVLAQKKSVLIETVVIQKERRGQGLGRKLIELAEDHARNQGYDAIYLFTTDKEKFYERLGYDYCKPVNTLGAQMLENCAVEMKTNTPIALQEDSCSGECNSSAIPMENDDVITGNENMNNTSQDGVSSIESQSTPPLSLVQSPPPPPPPPPPHLLLLRCAVPEQRLYIG
ncbi:putative N-acetyltransferase 6-like [Apostichopus japonicus]|uniref:Putative N-acetyltransferase 6-like n=1 Tax=Stichopus japonicus TaxID=307972 RepID=A0A2G8JQY0_STIJA|nr:putative N-acetyltransferase 6-like [Apostichopus japonicus]